MKFIEKKAVNKILEWYSDKNHWKQFLDFIWEVELSVNSLPTLEIDTLQRYEHTDLNADMLKDDNWEYVKYSDLVELLNR